MDDSFEYHPSSPRRIFDLVTFFKSFQNRFSLQAHFPYPSHLLHKTEINNL